MFILEWFFKQLPDWLIPFVISVLAWFGAHYFFLAERIVRTMAASDCAERERQFCECAAELLFETDKLAVSLFTASFTLVEIEATNREFHQMRRALVADDGEDNDPATRICDGLYNP